MNLLAVIGSDGRWQPGIGDPSAMGWVTVAAYGITALVCLIYAVRSARAGLPRGHQMLWLAVAGLMLLLGINKQLDLQSLLTQIGRDTALAQGWYEQRGGMQRAFIVAMAAAGALGMAALFALTRRQRRRNWPALAGLCLLTVFLVIRAASFHHVDAMIHGRIAGVKLNWLMELGGIAMVCVAAIINIKLAARAADDSC